MDKNLLSKKLNSAFPGVVLESRRFGRSTLTSIWIEAQNIQKVATHLKTDSEIKLDWLENLSVVEFENIFVVSYFVRSTMNPLIFVLRASAIPPAPDQGVLFPSVKQIWSMAFPMEKEIESSFGIFFQNEFNIKGQEKFITPPNSNLWEGFPLRKSFQFPKEFMAINHARPPGRQLKKPLES